MCTIYGWKIMVSRYSHTAMSVKYCTIVSHWYWFFSTAVVPATGCIEGATLANEKT
jgi:hypothetical protein